MQSYQRFQRVGHTAFNTSGTNAATFVSRDCGGYALGSSQRIAHNGTHAETRAFRMGVLSLPSDRFARFGNPAWSGVRTANFAAFWPWPEALSKNAESLRNGDALLCASLLRGAAALLGCAALFAIW